MSDKNEQPSFVVNQSIVDPTTDSKTQLALSRNELIYSILGQLLGFFCVIGGIILCLNGVAGSSNWTAKILGFESELNDAGPGVILLVVGLFFVFITRYKFEHKK